MLDFHKYLMRYGEFGVQAIIERIERNEGIRHTAPVLLEDRWNALMGKTTHSPSPMAA
jgi:hypothetical protein